jgi:hypothetical protein
MVEELAQLKTKISLPFLLLEKMALALTYAFENIIEAHGGYLSHQTDSDLSGGTTLHHLFYSWNN